MFASVLQALGLVAVVGCGFVLGAAQGGIATGVAAVYVGLAMERDH
jgi:hypothetical protein